HRDDWGDNTRIMNLSGMKEKQDNSYPNIDSPAFVLEERKLIRNLQMLEHVRRTAGVEIILALKAVALWPVFPRIRQYLDGATASSLNESLLIHEHMVT